MSKRRHIKSPQLQGPLDALNVLWPSVSPESFALSKKSTLEVKLRVNEEEISFHPDEAAVLRQLFQARGKPVANSLLSSGIPDQFRGLRRIIKNLNIKLGHRQRIRIRNAIGSGYFLEGVGSCIEVRY